MTCNIYHDLDLLYHSVYVEDSTVTSTDDRLVLQNGYLSIKLLAHVAGISRVTKDKSSGYILIYNNVKGTLILLSFNSWCGHIKWSHGFIGVGYKYNLVFR